MTHPLIEFMLTPMAAPETRRLKRLRMAWIALCCGLALAVAGNSALVALFGPGGALPALLLAVATPVMGLVYFRAKSRADAALGTRPANPGDEA